MGSIFGKRIKDENQVEDAITFVEKGTREDAISIIDHNINTPTKFAILKTTEGGKYMRGNTLYYELNGVSIYTEPDNIIFVDLENNTLWIRKNEAVQNQINPTDPEKRQYVILYTDLGYESAEDGFPFRWESVVGRTECYNNIKDNAAVIDIDHSLVLVETVPLKDSLSVRDFMNYLKNSDIIIDETFDINDYAGGEDGSEYI